MVVSCIIITEEFQMVQYLYMPDGGAMLHVNFNVAMSIQLPQQSS